MQALLEISWMTGASPVDFQDLVCLPWELSSEWGTVQRIAGTNFTHSSHPTRVVSLTSLQRKEGDPVMKVTYPGPLSLRQMTTVALCLPRRLETQCGVCSGSFPGASPGGWHKVILALESLRLEDCKLENRLGYRVRSRPVWMT